MSKTTIPTAGLADAAVTTAKITDANITTAKIANDAVENTKLDLTANYAFSGTISGAGGGKLLQTQSALCTNSSAHNSICRFFWSNRGYRPNHTCGNFIKSFSYDKSFIRNV